MYFCLSLCFHDNSFQFSVANSEMVCMMLCYRPTVCAWARLDIGWVPVGVLHQLGLPQRSNKLDLGLCAWNLNLIGRFTHRNLSSNIFLLFNIGRDPSSMQVLLKKGTNVALTKPGICTIELKGSVFTDLDLNKLKCFSWKIKSFFIFHHASLFKYNHNYGSVKILSSKTGLKTRVDNDDVASSSVETRRSEW